MQPSDPSRHLSLLEEEVLLLALENVLQPGRFVLDGDRVRNGPDLAQGELPREVVVRDEVLRLLAHGHVEVESAAIHRLTPGGWTQAEAVRASRLALLETQQLPDEEPTGQPRPDLSEQEREVLRAALLHDGDLALLRASDGGYLNSRFGPGPVRLQPELDRLVLLGLMRRTPLASTSRAVYTLTRAGRALALTW